MCRARVECTRWYERNVDSKYNRVRQIERQSGVLGGQIESVEMRHRQLISGCICSRKTSHFVYSKQRHLQVIWPIGAGSVPTNSQTVPRPPTYLYWLTETTTNFNGFYGDRSRRVECSIMIVRLQNYHESNRDSFHPYAAPLISHVPLTATKQPRFTPLVYTLYVAYQSGKSKHSSADGRERLKPKAD